MLVALPSSLLLPPMLLLLLLLLSLPLLLWLFIFPCDPLGRRSCSQFTVASCQLPVYSCSHSLAFSFRFRCLSSSSSCTGNSLHLLLAPQSSVLWRSPKRKCCCPPSLLLLWVYDLFLSANALSSHTLSHTHTHVAGSVSQPPRHLSPAPSARLSVSDACRCRRCLLLLLLPCSHSHSASLLLLRFVLVAALTALPRRRCSASALPRSRSRCRSLSRFRSLSRSRRQPLTSVKLNSKYYFLDTLLSGRRRVKQTSCSIRQPAIDRAGHIESGLQQQQRRRTQALFELWLQLESRSRCSLFSFGVGQQETEPGVASSALSNCE